MSCWPAILVGAVSVAIIIVRVINGEWMDLVYQGGIGIGLTLFFWLLCFFLGSEISFGVFIIPAIVFLSFLLFSWLFTKNLNDRGCCVKCIEKPSPPPEPTPEAPSTCPPVLKATTL
jgi:hypothetical protein